MQITDLFQSQQMVYIIIAIALIVVIVIAVLLLTAKPPTEYVYILSSSSGKLITINASNDHIISTIAAGPSPRGFALINNDYVYITQLNNTSLSVVNISNDRLIKLINIKEVSTWATGGIAVTPNKKYLYIANPALNNVTIVSTSTNNITNTIDVGSYPIAIAVSKGSNYAYVIDTGQETTTNQTYSIGSSISEINLTTNIVTKQITHLGRNGVLNNIITAIAVSQDGKYLYVAISSKSNTSTIAIINIATGSIVNVSIGGNFTSSIVVSLDGKHIYASNYYGDIVYVIDTKNGAVTNSIAVGSKPVGMGMTINGKRLYVINYNDMSVSVIDTIANKLADTITIGAKPKDIIVT